MVADCQKRRDIDRVVVYRLDRFARNSLDHGVYAHALKQTGATLASVSEPISDDPGGRMTRNVLNHVA
jgi:DNA invertase Pin-like site-specific DNA recombinase